MKRVVLLVVFWMVLANHFSYAQQKELCESPSEIEDLNSITKCEILNSKQEAAGRYIAVKVTATNSRRFLKRRKLPKKNAISSSSTLNTSGIDATAIKKTVIENNISSLAKIERKALLKKAIRFSEVDEIPMFTSCKSKSKDKNIECFNKQMIKHVKKYFKYPEDAEANRIQGDVWVRFVIDENGDVSNVKAMGPKNGKLLEQESLKVVKNLPKFKPGKNKGKVVMTKYAFPISFSLD